MRSRSTIILALSLLGSLAACGSATKTTEPPAETTVAAAAGPALATPPRSASFIVPHEVGRVLASARADVRTASGNPALVTKSKDATGAGRTQTFDVNWKVCAQDLAPGTDAAGSEPITFAVVKLTETCP